MRVLSFFVFIPLLAAQSRLYVADENGNAVTVIDAQSNRVAATIPVSPGPQAVAISTDGRYLYVSSSGRNQLDAVDLRTLKVVKSAAVGLKPGCLAVSPDGRRVFLCLDGQAGLDVVDTAPMQRMRTIDFAGGGAPRNLYITPDSTRMIATGDRKLTIINVRSEKPEFTIPVDGAAEAVAIDSDKDLVIHRLFVQVAGFKGFEVIDYAARKVTEKVALPAAPSALAVTADHKTLWVAAGDSVAEFSLPDLKKIATIPADHGVAGIVCSADSRRCFVSNSGAGSGSGTVSVIATAEAKELVRIPVGKTPGRMVLTPEFQPAGAQ
jgi:YVTN family beta-propeller protein